MMPDLEGGGEGQLYLCRVNYASGVFCSALSSKGKNGDSSKSDHEFEDFGVKFHLILIVLNSIDGLCRNTFTQEKRPGNTCGFSGIDYIDFKCKGKLLFFKNFPLVFFSSLPHSSNSLVDRGLGACGKENKNSLKIMQYMVEGGKTKCALHKELNKHNWE